MPPPEHDVRVHSVCPGHIGYRCAGFARLLPDPQSTMEYFRRGPVRRPSLSVLVSFGVSGAHQERAEDEMEDMGAGPAMPMRKRRCSFASCSDIPTPFSVSRRSNYVGPETGLSVLGSGGGRHACAARNDRRLTPAHDVRI